MERFVLRPYRTSTTYANLKARGEGVLHVTDDVLLLAQTAIGAAMDPFPATAADERGRRRDPGRCLPLLRVPGRRARRPRRPDSIVVETVAQGRHRDFFGFNRAKHAVVEAAILATRTAWLPLRELLLEFRKLEVLVDKTGGPAESAAFTLLYEFLREAAAQQGVDPDLRPSPP